LRLLHPEHLCERDGLIVGGIAEYAQDRRVAVVIAQRYGLGRSGHFIAFGLVMAEHVGAQRALTAFRPGRLVVGDPVRRDEERRNGVDQSRRA
jgi:hypothetical protein